MAGQQQIAPFRRDTSFKCVMKTKQEGAVACLVVFFATPLFSHPAPSGLIDMWFCNIPSRAGARSSRHRPEIK